MPFVLQLALRSIAGFLVQMVPCAALCLIPFAGRLRDEQRTYAMAAGIVAVALVPFVAVSTLMIADDQYFLRNTAQNIIFLATVAALGALYVRRVSAPAAQKVFVISLVMCYGYFVNVVYRITSDLLALPYDDFKYYPERLLVMAIANTALFVPMAYLMRYTRRVFDAPVSTRTWWHMAALPAILILTFLVGGVLPPLPAEQLFYSLRYAMSAMAIVLLWWALRAVRDASEHARKQAQLEDALAHEQHAHGTVREELAATRAHMEELERKLAESERAATGPTESAGDGAASHGKTHRNGGNNAPIVVSSANHAVSLRPADILYIESLNRMRHIHLTSGEDIVVSMSLAGILDLLPEDRFAYCHRSVVVNLAHVRSITPTEIELVNGMRVDASRRRVPELRQLWERQLNARQVR